MKDVWKPKHNVWFKKNDDDTLGNTEELNYRVREREKVKHLEREGYKWD